MSSRPFKEIYEEVVKIAQKDGPNYKQILQREVFMRYILPKSHFIGGNFWILKTTY